MEQNRKSVHRYIDEVVGAKRVYILILLLIQAALGVSSVLYALFLRDIVDGAVTHDFAAMVRSICAFAGLVVCQLALRALSRHMSELACSTYENAFKSRLFGELLSRDFGSVTAIHSGEWMNRLTSDTAVVADGLASIVPGVAGAAVRIVGALTMILVIEARFAYILIPGGAVFAALTYVFRRHLKRLHKSVQERDGEVRADLMHKAIENMTVAVPEVMVKEKAEEIIRNYARNFGVTDNSIPMDKLCEMLGLNEEAMKTSIMPAAEAQVKNDLLLEAIVAAEGFAPTEEETEEYIAKTAEKLGAKAEELKQYFGVDFIAEEQKKEMASNIIFDTAIITEAAPEEKAEEKAEETEKEAE